MLCLRQGTIDAMYIYVDVQITHTCLARYLSVETVECWITKSLDQRDQEVLPIGDTATGSAPN